RVRLVLEILSLVGLTLLGIDLGLIGLVRLACACGQETALPWSPLTVALLTVTAWAGIWLAEAVLADVTRAVTTAGRRRRTVARFTAGSFRAVARPGAVARLGAKARLGSGA